MKQNLPITNNVYAGKIVDFSQELEQILKNNNNRKILLDFKVDDKRKYAMGWLSEHIHIYQEIDDITQIFITTKDGHLVKKNQNSNILHIYDSSKWIKTTGDLFIPVCSSLISSESITSENYKNIIESQTTIISIGIPNIQQYSKLMRKEQYGYLPNSLLN